jgi:hypothetical protein
MKPGAATGVLLFGEEVGVLLNFNKSAGGGGGGRDGDGGAAVFEMAVITTGISSGT